MLMFMPRVHPGTPERVLTYIFLTYTFFKLYPGLDDAIVDGEYFYFAWYSMEMCFIIHTSIIQSL